MNDERLKRLGQWHMRLYHLNPEELRKKLAKHRRQFEEEMKEMSLALAELDGPAIPGKPTAPHVQQQQEPEQKKMPPWQGGTDLDRVFGWQGKTGHRLEFIERNFATVLNFTVMRPPYHALRSALAFAILSIQNMSNWSTKHCDECQENRLFANGALKTIEAVLEQGELASQAPSLPPASQGQRPMSPHVAATPRDQVTAPPDEFPESHERSPLKDRRSFVETSTSAEGNMRHFVAQPPHESAGEP